jgi:hypothetical protein
MLTGARKVAEKNAGTSGAFADVAAAAASLTDYQWTIEEMLAETNQK